MDPLFVVDGFYAGADGIFVGGCHLGECHYQLGNYDAMLTAMAYEKGDPPIPGLKVVRKGWFKRIRPVTETIKNEHRRYHEIMIRA